MDYPRVGAAARRVSLIGDFNDWNRESYPLQGFPNCVWQLKLLSDAFAHDQKVKLHVIGADGSRRDRIPACTRRAVQGSHDA